MFVMLISLLKHLVSQIVEKNKPLNLAELLSFTFISLWFISNNFDVFLNQPLSFQTSCCSFNYTTSP